MGADLKDRVVIITGASSGIGAATAVACGRNGMAVVLASRNERRLRAVAQAVAEAGGKALVVPTDVCDPEQIEELTRKSIAHFDRIDVLVANAGLGYPRPVQLATDADLRSIVAVNLLGAIRSVRSVLPSMLHRGAGHVIVVTSVI